MCVVNEQDSEFRGSHWLMVYQDKKAAYFIDSLERDFTHYGLKIKRPVYQVSRRLQCSDSKLCGTYLVLFGCILPRGLDLNNIWITLHSIADSMTSSSTITSRKNYK